MKRTRSIAVLVSVAGMLAAAEAHASSYPLDQVIAESAAAKLAKLGINSTDDLLAQGATPSGRRKVAKDSQIAPARIFEWVRLCDLVRIKGVGPEIVKLFNAVKIDSVRKLQRQKAPALLKRLEKANAKAKITEKMPSEQHLADWIDQAKKLKIVVK